jgi:hypothetical protein
MFNLPISILRYYDIEGLLPDLESAFGIVSLCHQMSKKYGLEIKVIKEFI